MPCAMKISLYDRHSLEVLRELAVTQYKLKDQNTALGMAWSLLHPLIMLLILYVFFMDHFGNRIQSYPLYLLIGLIHFSHFSTTTGAAMVALPAMRNLCKNAVFPKELLVFATVTSKSVELLISLLICQVLAWFTVVEVSWRALLLPVAWLAQVSLVLWMSIFLATAYPFIRDIGHIYQVFLRLLIFISPIFYEADSVGNDLARAILLMNPLTHVMGMSRALITGQTPDFMCFGAVIVLNIALCCAGVRAFRRCEPHIADRL